METTSNLVRPFVHLHCHSHYSLLDGASAIDRLVARAKQHGMNALALTDHGNLHGALEFYQAAKDAGIKPILGYEAYIAPGRRTERDASSMKEASFHLTLLARDRTGFKNLIKLASAAMLDGFYFKPRIDKELLEAHHEGIVCLSGCASSEFSRAILKGHGGEKELEDAIEIARWFHRLFGDRYFIEVMNNGVEVQRLQMLGALEVARRLSLPVVTTSDAHYVDREDAVAQDVMLCINTGKFRTDTNRMRMEGDQFYLRSPEEMYAAFPGMEDAVARSQQIADTVDIDLELGKRHFPSFKLPQAVTAEQFLRELCIKGLKERYAGDESMCPEGELAPIVLERLDRELSVINKLGFPNYFLIVWDFVRHAREQNIPATARGSGVGALVCYALYLSHVCPIRYDLLFERFLDESRREAPDIDIDFCKDRRGEVIRYVKDKYGEENVAQIGTFGTLAARAAIKDVARVMGLPVERANRISSMVPEELGISLDDAVEKGDELRQAYSQDPEVRELIDLARKIEGLARNIGTHAAAVVIADRPLTEYVPLGRVTGKTDIITQWSMGDVEAAGLLKMDFLGLRNLTILSKAVDIIEQTTGKRVDPYRFPLDDKATFALLCRGETKGIFQLESGGIRDLLQKMKPDHFHDIIATNALYRPGPLEGGMVRDYVEVKHGRQKAEYKHPVLQEILAETHGVMVYQEQVMRILNRLGGIELANAYTCIKAISKKKETLIAKNYEQFIRGAQERGLPASEAQELWNLIIKFAGYGFNKSHSTAYALIAYMTAYLKAHYPVEFMAALLSGDIQGRNFKTKDSMVEHIEDCQRMGIEIVMPDINRSNVDFTVCTGKIHFGLAAIKGCGGGSAGEALVAERKRRGPFKDIFDLCERVDASHCGKATLETLIKAGALDCLGGTRKQLMSVLDKAMQAGAAMLADRKCGQKSLFGAIEDAEPVAKQASLPDVGEFEPRERLLMEKEVLGFYLTSHPLAEHVRTLEEYCSHTIEKIGELPERAEVIVGGMLAAIKHSNTKSPKPGAPSRYVMFDLEDVSGSVRCILWPNQYVEYGELVKPDAIVVVQGSVNRRGGDEANLIVDEILPLDQLSSRYTTGVVIRIDEGRHGADVLPKIREVVRGYPGDRDLELMLQLRDGSRVRMKSTKLRLEITTEFQQRIDDLLGPGNIRRITQPPRPERRRPVESGRRR
ncbi:MAG: DNA polymerase III subunit alpha [Planctomycetes bacterium]|nr:DNA polymerase III subunit alpha [Planctomycetota bacterium]